MAILKVKKAKKESKMYYASFIMTGLVVVMYFVAQTSTTAGWSSLVFPMTTTTSSTIANNNEEGSQKSKCETKLDLLDEFYDARRGARPKPVRPIRNALFDQYEPDAACLVEERFGTNDRHIAFGDGPKFVCGVDYLAQKTLDKKNSCLVYSVGSNNDISFERAVQKFLPSCELHTFDFTIPTSKFVGHSVSQFHEWGLGLDGEKATIKGLTTTLKSLQTVVKELGHVNRTIDILKIDCEGCEWAVMPPVFDAIARGDMVIDQIQIELHNALSPDLNLFLDKADMAQLRTFHKERNAWGCGGTACIEYSLMSHSFLRDVNKHYLC